MIAPPPQRWHIAGPGPIGCLLASHFFAAGFDVSLIARTEQRAERLAQGFERKHSNATLEVKVPVMTATTTGIIEGLIITTKAQDAVAAFESVAGHLLPDAPVIVLHNGMGTCEKIQQLRGSSPVFSGTTTEGAYFRNPNELIYAGPGWTKLGRQGEIDPPPWFKDFSSSLADVRWETDIERVLWEKLVINAAINPLTAIHNCRNGELLNTLELKDELRALCEELSTIVKAVGFNDLAENCWEVVKQVVSATADNRSSMLQDIRANRPTEIDFINGYICQRAADLEIPCKLNQEMCESVRQL